MSNARWHSPTVRMAWCTRPPPRRVWATANPFPVLAEQRVDGQADMVVVHEGVAAVGRALATEADVADDVEPGRVGRHEEHRHARLRRARQGR